ncbi:hypothetical protein B6U70_02350 [Euryarchaeota archaeon ex4484_162]|nr:MAG: hypothetical protein B6U70_02350 [Euryarchaeota archaeon ex4484_162]
MVYNGVAVWVVEFLFEVPTTELNVARRIIVAMPKTMRYFPLIFYHFHFIIIDQYINFSM